MRKVLLNSAVSLDHYIARPDGDVEWLHDADYEIDGEDYGMAAFYENIDTTLMGNNTYQAILGFDVPFPYPYKTNYVFTRTDDVPKAEFVSFVNRDIIDFVRGLKEGNGKDIWLVGGGEINTLLLRNGLIDELHLTIIPCLLGQGIPLFKGLADITKFDLISNKSYGSGLVHLHFNTRHD